MAEQKFGSNMTVGEVVVAQLEMQEQIKKLLVWFEDSTGVRVKEVIVARMASGKIIDPIFYVRLQIELVVPFST